MIWSVGGDPWEEYFKFSQEVIILDECPNFTIQSAVLYALCLVSRLLCFSLI
jgi:hypothetical protein